MKNSQNKLDLDKIKKLVIIGSGPAGLTAAIYAARANIVPLVIEGPKPGGQLTRTSFVENWPGEKHILGSKLMKKIHDHAQSVGTDFLNQEITQVDFTKLPFTLTTNKNDKILADSVIIATGAHSKRLKVPGEDKYWGKGISTCGVCDGPFYKNKSVLIVGGGNRAMDQASFMTKYTNNITIVQNLPELTASYVLQEPIISNPNISIIFNSTITEIKGDGQRVTQAVITNQKSEQKTILDINGIFLAIGTIPNSSIFKNAIELDESGYIVLKKKTQTSVAGVFAAGDVADHDYRQAITASAMGCISALDAIKYLKNN